MVFGNQQLISFKQHLKRVAANAIYSHLLNSLAIEIKSILNSRSSIPISNDPNKLLALTPGYFTINDSLTSIPKQDFSPLLSNRLSAWQLTTKIQEDFWKRWHKKYNKPKFDYKSFLAVMMTNGVMYLSRLIHQILIFLISTMVLYFY